MSGTPVTVDHDVRWLEIQKLSLHVASKDGTPTEIESALCGAVVRARDAMRELATVREALRDIAECRMGSGHCAVSMEEFGPWAREVAVRVLRGVK